jgi:hypothetical protein
MARGIREEAAALEMLVDVAEAALRFLAEQIIFSVALGLGRMSGMGVKELKAAVRGKFAEKVVGGGNWGGEFNKVHRFWEKD